MLILNQVLNITVSNSQSFMPLHYILCASMLMLYVACFFFYCLYCGRLQFTLLDAALLCRSTKTPPRQNRNSTPSHPHPSPYEWHTPPSETKTQRCWWTLKLTTCSSPASRLFTVSSWRLQEFIIDTPAMLFRFGEMSELVLPIYSSLFLIVRAWVRACVHCAYHLGMPEATAM